MLTHAYLLNTHTATYFWYNKTAPTWAIAMPRPENTKGLRKPNMEASGIIITVDTSIIEPIIRAAKCVEYVCTVLIKMGSVYKSKTDTPLNCWNASRPHDRYRALTVPIVPIRSDSVPSFALLSCIRACINNRTEWYTKLIHKFKWNRNRSRSLDCFVLLLVKYKIPFQEKIVFYWIIIL